MVFDKPVVFLKDIPEIMSVYSLGSVVAAKYLGGIPNVTYRVITPHARLAVRICNKGYTSPEHLNTEIEILQHLTSAGYKESPRVITGNNGSVVQNWKGYPTFAMQLIEGET